MFSYLIFILILFDILLIFQFISAQRLQSDGCKSYAENRCCLPKFSGFKTESVFKVKCKYINI